MRAPAGASRFAWPATARRQPEPGGRGAAERAVSGRPGRRLPRRRDPRRHDDQAGACSAGPGHVACNDCRRRPIPSASPASGPGLLLRRCCWRCRPRPWPAAGAARAVAWWVWPLALFVACFLMGIVAVPAGIGGGTLFVPIVGGFFPFHLDFVRGAGLLVALASALAAGPMLLRGGLASLRLALPLALLASASSIGGAMLGLAMPAARGADRAGRDRAGHRRADAGVEEVRVSAGRAARRAVAGAGAERRVHRRRLAAARVDWQVHRTPLGPAALPGHRRAGRHVRHRRRLGQRAGAEPADGRAAEGVGRHLGRWCCRWSTRRPPGSTSTAARCCR